MGSYFKSSLSSAGAKLHNTIMLRPMCHHWKWLNEDSSRGRDEPGRK